MYPRQGYSLYISSGDVELRGDFFIGVLVPTEMEDKGLGGAMTVKIACSGCGNSLH